MPERRVFSDDNIQRKADDYHGGCRYVRTQPDMEARGMSSVNIEMSFEEAMRLSLAIQSALLALNKYNRTKAAGREMGLLLSVKKNPTSVSESIPYGCVCSVGRWHVSSTFGRFFSSRPGAKLAVSPLMGQTLSHREARSSSRRGLRILTVDEATQ
jgi:hypothetical protein